MLSFFAQKLKCGTSKTKKKQKNIHFHSKGKRQNIHSYRCAMLWNNDATISKTGIII